MHTRRGAVAALLASPFAPRLASAQAWPTRPVMLVHGFAAGGNADSLSRVMANALSAEIREQVVVEAKPGAGGNLASELVARAQPDAHTIILLTGGHAVSAALYRSLRFKPVDDFAFVSLVATFPFVIATRAESPLKTIADVIEAARREPGKLTYSSVGFGSTQHLTGELFAVAAGIKMTHVPYRGGMQPLSDLIGGRIDLIVESITVTGPAIRAGTIRGLGVTSLEPWPALPEVPPISGTLPDFHVPSWSGIAAPAGTPPAVIFKLNTAIGNALQSERVKQQLGTLCVKAEASTPERMRDFVASEIVRWAAVIEKASIDRI